MASSVPSQILTRIGVLLAALLALFAVALLGVRSVERRGRDEIIADAASEHGRLLDALLAQAERPLRLFADSYARRVSFTRPGTNSRTAVASPEGTLRTGLRTFELDAAWVLEASGAVRLHEAGMPSAELAEPPLDAAQLTALENPAVSFYMERGGSLYRVRGARLATDATHPTAPRGWLFAAKRWDAADLSKPKLPVDGRVALLPPSAAGEPATEHLPVRIERVLRDAGQRPLRLLRVDYRPLAVDVVEASDWLETTMMVAFCVAMLGLLLFCLFRWVVVPAGTMERILAQRDTQALAPLLGGRGYLARLADLVRQLLDTKHRLEQTLEERARLGRELHDGVIQTIYAAGMGIAGARATLRDNPAGAERILDDTRAELNATIVDLRVFIGGLEPEQVRSRKFSEAVRAMADLMESARTVRFIIEIDDETTGQLSAIQRMHLLQIVREALSNAARHSNASEVTVVLRREAGGLFLEVADNGRGLDVADGDDGRGLANFRARAKELGGSVAVESGAGGGTRVRVTLPPPS